MKALRVTRPMKHLKRFAPMATRIRQLMQTYISQLILKYPKATYHMIASMATRIQCNSNVKRLEPKATCIQCNSDLNQLAPKATRHMIRPKAEGNSPKVTRIEDNSLPRRCNSYRRQLTPQLAPKVTRTEGNSLPKQSNSRRRQLTP